MSQIFVSYSRRDINIVQKLALDLEESGYDVWWDVSDLKGGDSWARTIEAALRASKYCLIVLSPDSIESIWVEKEYTFAIAQRLKIIPILFKSCQIPMALANLHYIDFRENRYILGKWELLRALRENLQPSPIFAKVFSDAMRRSLKERFLTASRDPMWQMIGAVIALIALVFTVYTFFAGGANIDIPVSSPKPTSIVGTAAKTPTKDRTLSYSSLSATPREVSRTQTMPPTSTNTWTSTPTNTFTATPTPTHMPVATVMSTVTPSATATPTTTATRVPPTPTSTPTRVLLFLYEPTEDASFNDVLQIHFGWAWAGADLRYYEFFALSVWHQGKPQERHALTWTKEPWYSLTLDTPPVSDIDFESGAFYWNVAVVQEFCPEHEWRPCWEALYESEPRRLYINVPVPSCTPPPPPPTDTPEPTSTAYG